MPVTVLPDCRFGVGLDHGINDMQGGPEFGEVVKAKVSIGVFRVGLVRVRLQASEYFVPLFVLAQPGKT